MKDKTTKWLSYSVGTDGVEFFHFVVIDTMHPETRVYLMPFEVSSGSLVKIVFCGQSVWF